MQPFIAKMRRAEQLRTTQRGVRFGTLFLLVPLNRDTLHKAFVYNGKIVVFFGRTDKHVVFQHALFPRENVHHLRAEFTLSLPQNPL